MPDTDASGNVTKPASCAFADDDAHDSGIRLGNVDLAGPVCVFDRDGRVLFSDAPRATGASWLSDWPEKVSSVLGKAFADAAMGQSTRLATSRGTAEKARWFDVLVAPLDGPEGRTVIGVARDVTACRRAEGELKVAKAAAERDAFRRTEFVATMSHELRTPLSAVVSHLDLVGIDPSGDATRLACVRDAVEASLRIVDDALDIARIEADGLPLASAPFDLGGLVGGLADLLSPLARRKGLRFDAEIAPDCPAWIVGDAGRLRQVLVNLLGNAIKFTGDGRVALRVEAEEVGEGLFDVSFAVADTGIGVSDDTRSAMLRHFSRPNPEVRRRYGGTGIGLAICRHLVERMGGNIDVASGEEGLGTTFAVHLPGRRSAVPPPPKAVEERVRAAVRSVLVVDDDDLHREVGAGMFAALGCQVDVAVSGAAAVAAVRVGNYDLVLLDERLPDMDGCDVASTIRDTDEPPLIVACTATSRSYTASSEEYDGFLCKPLRLESLGSTLARLSGTGIGGGPTAVHADLGAHLPAFRRDLEDFAARLGSGGPLADALQAHRLISSAAVFGFVDLGILLQRFEAMFDVPTLRAASTDVANEVARALAQLSEPNPAKGGA